ncbi:hypothetical protein FHT87_005146 [Rhizobium sp. BK316]|uniref:hypothetical protein n=1 Tax=Rhizobium sp. BK316 TaxID=2587053 RepID=UPI00160BE028|nr:hypothetical protein [Rhizobium sp. BK316]MBB3411193.1 hypothetical protein [Rhizobium sp. BK316]
MANIEINELPPAASLDGTELIAIDKNTGPGYVTQQTSINSLSSLGVTQPYVVAQVTVGLPNSRRLAGAAGQINVSDGGPGADISIGLATNGVVAGTYGDGTHVSRVTIDATGRVTAASQVVITNQGDVVGPASSVAGDIPIFSNTTGKLLSDSGKALPAGAIVGTTDTQTLTNKSIDAGQLTGTVAYARLPVGTGVNTVAAGDDSRIVNALNKNNNLSDVSNPSSARTNIGAAASGVNFDITSLTGLTTALSISQGGTGTTTSTGTGSVVLSVSPALTGIPTVPTASVGTNTTQAASTAFVLAQASSTTPVMDGTGAVGVSTRFARADHVHPSDTSRLAAANNLSDVANPAAAAANIGAITTSAVNTFTAAQAWSEGTAIASAATLVLGNGGNFFHVTGTAIITAISGTPSPVTLAFDDAATLTNNANIILPGGADIITAAGDVAVFVFEGSGVWRCVSYTRAVAPPPIVTPWVSYTPTFNGIGTATNVKCRSRRVGANLEVEVAFATGTVTGTTFDMTMGFNGVNGSVVCDTFWNGFRPVVGVGAIQVAGAISIYVLGLGGSNLVNLSFAASGRDGLTPVAGSVLGTGNPIILRFSTPIDGWN